MGLATSPTDKLASCALGTTTLRSRTHSKSLPSVAATAGRDAASVDWSDRATMPLLSFSDRNSYNSTAFIGVLCVSPRPGEPHRLVPRV